jgi:hypothetical protein
MACAVVQLKIFPRESAQAVQLQYTFVCCPQGIDLPGGRSPRAHSAGVCRTSAGGLAPSRRRLRVADPPGDRHTCDLLGPYGCIMKHCLPSIISVITAENVVTRVLMMRLATFLQSNGCGRVQDECQQRLGEMESRVRRYTFDEIRQKNEAGECWLLLNGTNTVLPVLLLSKVL